MMNENKKNLFDYISRQLLVEFINLSRHKNNKDFKKYVLKEASYEQVMLAVWKNKVINETVSIDVEDAERQAHGTLGPIMQMPLWMLAGNVLSKSGIYNAPGMIAGAAAKGAAKIGLGGIAKGIGGVAGLYGGVVPAMASGMLMGALSGIFSKAVRFMLAKYYDPCMKTCKRMIKGDPLAKFRIPVCVSNCKIIGFSKVLATLQTQKAQCVKAGPKQLKCEHNFNAQVIHYQDQIEEERQNLAKLQASYNEARANMRRRPVSMTAKPPSPQNINALK